MSEHPNEAPADLEDTQTQLRESLDNAKKLVQRTKFLLSGDAEADPA